MSDENFLERWSRRKRDVARAEQPEPAKAPEPRDDEPTSDLRADAPSTASTDAPAVDLSQLPSLESITAGTDIRGFLAPGVPSALRHAALRRAWSADPTIRDFVGLSENAWDFTAPESIPGFGAIGTPEEVRKLLAQVMGDPAASEETRAEAPAADVTETPLPTPVSITAAEPSEPDPAAGESASGPVENRPRADRADMLQHSKDDVASREERSQPQQGSIRRPPFHGRALPK
jgi:hypothetical protein